MNHRSLRIALLTTALAGLPAAALAQFPPPPPPPGAPPAAAPQVQDRWPSPPPPRQQAQPQAEDQQPQPKPAAPAPTRKPAAAPAGGKPAATAKPKVAPRAPATTVACSGVFAKDSTHLKLAQRFDSRNLTWGEVDGPEGSKINASVLYPNDPKRRLEVLWNDDAGRSDLQLIAINGQSQWTAPRGLKLGMALAALEKANGKPFKLTGFGADGTASVVSWEGGAMSKLPGGCKVGVRLAAPAPAPEIAGQKELLSSDAALKAAKATIGEILIGY